MPFELYLEIYSQLRFQVFLELPNLSPLLTGDAEGHKDSGSKMKSARKRR